jgi:hypothetical protein
MSDNDEQRWRDGLKARGPAWVRAKLLERPGRYDDPVFDVVFVEPLPTRAFCQAWCAEAENKIFQLSGYGKTVVILLVLLVVFVAGAVGSLTTHTVAPRPFAGGGGGGGSAGGFRGQSDGPINSATQSQSGTTSSAPSVCGYLSYPTARCGAR